MLTRLALLVLWLTVKLSNLSPFRSLIYSLTQFSTQCNRQSVRTSCPPPLALPKTPSRSILRSCRSCQKEQQIQRRTPWYVLCLIVCCPLVSNL